MAPSTLNGARILLLAMATELSSGQEFASGRLVALPATAYSCPQMSSLGARSSLKTQPWSFLRTIDVVQSIVGEHRTFVRELGQIRGSLFTWGTEYELHDPMSGRMITKIVNPGTFWDQTQDVYDCMHRKMGTIKAPFAWKNLFSSTYAQRQVLDGQGNHIANLVQEDLTKQFFGSQQRFISMEDLNGNSMVSMRHPSGGWNLNLFGEYFEVHIEMDAMNPETILPAMNPEFLSLVFANALASQSRFGPYVCYIIYLVAFVCCIIVGVTCWCRHKRRAREAYRLTSSEENESLASERKEIEAEKRGIWACCTRQKVVPKGLPQPPPLK